MLLVDVFLCISVYMYVLGMNNTPVHRVHHDILRYDTRIVSSA